MFSFNLAPPDLHVRRFVLSLAAPLLANLILPLPLGWAAAAPTKTPPTKAATTVESKKDEIHKPLSEVELRQAQAQLKAFDYLSVDFEQSMFRNLRKKTSLSSGKAYFGKPDHFRWALSKPNQDEWIYNGKTLSHYLPAKKEAVTYTQGLERTKELRLIVDMVLNFDALLSRYSLQSASQEEDLILIRLKPKEKGEVNAIELSLDTKADYLRELVLHFPNGNHTTISFKNPVKKPIKGDVFEIPAGTRSIAAP